MSNQPDAQVPADPAALQALVQLLLLRLAAAPPDPGADPRDRRTVAEVVKLYLADAEHELSEAAYVQRESFLAEFAADHGQLPVAECSPLLLKQWIRDREPRWKSAHTIRSANMAVQRAFNFAAQNRFIRENPFKGLSYRLGDPRGAMADADYQALLRSTDACFRRVLVFCRFTGCRPCEMRALCWENINLDRSVAVLRHHKTSKTQKEPRPRVIPLHPCVVKLLRWLLRHRQRPYVEVLREIVQGGPVHAEEYHRQALAAGVPPRWIYRLSEKAGVRSWRVGGVGAGGYWVWGLSRPPDQGIIRRKDRKGYYAHFWVPGIGDIQRKVGDTIEEARARLAELRAELGAEPGAVEPEPETTAERQRGEFVFLNAEGHPWKNLALSNRMQRARKRAGLPPSVALYCLRHAFATNGVRRNVHLKVLAFAMGHVDTRMIDRCYCHLDGDADLPLLLEAVQKMFAPAEGRKS